MATFEDSFSSAVAVVLSSATALPSTVEAVRPLGDAELLSVQKTLAEARRALDSTASLVAGEIAFRSRPSLGYDGLAQRSGFRTAEKLVQHTTKMTGRDAAGLVTAGGLVHEAQTPFPAQPWLVAVGAAVTAGTLSVQAAVAIRTGLREPKDSVTAAQLATAAAQLLAEAADLDASALLTRARQLRDDIDLAGVADRERQLHLERSFRRVLRPNGLPRYIVDPDIESAALWNDLYDSLTSPRQGGPRFVATDDTAWADSVVADERTAEQYAHDSITELLRLGSTASPDVIGPRPPAVRVLVTERALREREGLGFVEGSALAVSMGTVERAACAGGTVPLLFDDAGQALNLGRQQRLFSARQRVILAARDGGCRWIDCDRPPSWCEAHHIEHWHRDRGRTDVADGILLCRHHHLLLHNNDWSIERDADGFWLTAPPGAPGAGQRRLMPSASAALRDLYARSA